MDFSNVRILGYTHSSNFLGEDVFRFRTDKVLSIQGTLVDLTGTNRLSTGLWDEADVLSNFSEYEPVVVNGTTFGSGRLDSLSFEGGQDINTKNYVADITVSSTGNLFNLTGEFYTGIDKTNYHYINDIAEDFSYNTEGTEQSYTQRIALSCLSGDAGNPLTLAKDIAAHLFTVNSITGLISDYNEVNSNPIYAESIDSINNAYQVDKTVTFGSRSGTYSISRVHSVALGEDGNSTVEERGEIKGLDGAESWTSALTGLQDEIQTSYTRCSNVFDVYKASSAASLNPKIVSVSKNLNRFTDFINYTVSFDNRKANTANGYSHEQTSEVRKNQNGIYEVSIRGTIQGWGANTSQQFDAARTGYDIIKPSLKAEATAALAKHAPIFFGTVFTLSSNVTFSVFRGQVRYDYVYTTDYKYKSSTFRKEDVIIKDQYKTFHINRYGIFNQEEIIQRGRISSLSSRSMTLTLIGRSGWGISAYLVRARDIANRYMPGESLDALDPFINDLNYSFNITENTLNLSIVWSYTSPFNLEKTTGGEREIIV